MAKKVRATFYYRVSTKSETQLTSYNAQPEYYMDLLKTTQFKNFEHCGKMYCDYGISGTAMYNRDDFIKMLEDAGLDVIVERKEDLPDPIHSNRRIKQMIFTTSVNPHKHKKFDYIFTKNSSRFTRNINAYPILENLWRNNVYVYFMDLDICTEKWEEVSSTLRDQMSRDQAYSEKLSRDRKYVQTRYEKTNRVSGVCYGYNYHKKTKTTEPYYTINPEQAEVVRKVYNYYIEGLGDKSICKRLKEEGILTEKGVPFAASTIHKMLNNPKYIGMNTAGRYTTGTIFNKYKGVVQREDYMERLQETDSIPPIIDNETWSKVEEVRSTRVNPITKRGEPQPEHPFKDILECGYCGNHFIISREGESTHFRCATKRNKGVASCDVCNLYQKKLDTYINDLKNGELYAIIETDVEHTLISLITLIERYIQLLKNPEKIKVEEQARLEQELEKKEKARRKFFSMISDGDYDAETEVEIDNSIRELDGVIKGLKESIKNLQIKKESIYSKVNILFDCIYEELNIFNKRKKTYTEEEVIDMLEKIKVYGKTIYRRQTANKTPQTILVPILKITERAQGLINAGYSEFQYKYKNLMTDYEAPEEGDSELNPIDEFDLSIEDRLQFATKITKSNWPTGTSKYLTTGAAFDLDNGYIKDLGFEDTTIMSDIESHIQELKKEFEDLQ